MYTNLKGILPNILLQLVFQGNVHLGKTSTSPRNYIRQPLVQGVRYFNSILVTQELNIKDQSK